MYESASDGAFAVAVLPGEVRSVELETGGRVIGDIGLFSVMEEWGSVRFAVIPLRGNGSGEVRFRDLDGAPVYQPETISWGTGQD